MSVVKYCPLLQLCSMIKSEDGIKLRSDFFWSVGDFSFEKNTIGHIFTGQYYGLHNIAILHGTKLTQACLKFCQIPNLHHVLLK